MRSLLEARRLVAMALDRPFETVGEIATIGKVQGWDSIGHISIVLALEKQIGRMLRPEEIGQLESVADIAAILAISTDCVAKPSLGG